MTDPFATPASDQPSYGQPQYGPPHNGQTQHEPHNGQPQYGQPQYGQPQYGQPQSGHPQWGAPSYGSSPYGQPPYGQPQYGPPPYGQPQYGPPPYGPPPYGQPYPSGPRNGLGVAALVCSLVGVIFWVVGPLLGIIFGIIGRGRAKRGEATNGGLALAGLIIGVVLLLGEGAFIGYLATGSRGTLISCIANANGDQQTVDACNAQYHDDDNT